MANKRPPCLPPTHNQLMDNVIIFDTTLRDGEQSPGISLTPEEKIQIASALTLLGVDVIEAGFPAASEGDFLAVQRIAREIDGPIICALARASKGDIDKAFSAICDNTNPRLHVFLATSELHIREKLHSDHKNILGQIKAGVTQAKDLLDDVEFSPEDGSRTEREFLAEAVQTAIDCGATTINIPDTVGIIVPSDYAQILKNLQKDVPDLSKVTLSVHCHDDLGLAVANSIAGLKAGARQVECTINGLGERAGNCALEEIVMLMRLHQEFGLDSNIETTRLALTSSVVSRLSGYPVPANKAIVGANAFAHEAGIHQDGVLQNRETYEIIDAVSVGQTSNPLFLGKHSGRHALRAALSDLGYETATGGQLNTTFKAFKNLADRKKEITEEDLHALVSSDYSSGPELVRYSLTAGSANPLAKVSLKSPEGEVLKGKANGAGPIDALFRALMDALGREAELKEYRCEAASGLSEALCEATVILEVEGRSFTGRGTDIDTIRASGLAFLSAMAKATR